MLYIPEFKDMIGKDVEIIILVEPENSFDTAFISGVDYENRYILETINAAYADNMPDTEDQKLQAKMRRFHSNLITGSERW